MLPVMVHTWLHPWGAGREGGSWGTGCRQAMAGGSWESGPNEASVAQIATRYLVLQFPVPVNYRWQLTHEKQVLHVLLYLIIHRRRVDLWGERAAAHRSSFVIWVRLGPVPSRRNWGWGRLGIKAGSGGHCRYEGISSSSEAYLLLLSSSGGDLSYWRLYGRLQCASCWWYVGVNISQSFLSRMINFLLKSVLTACFSIKKNWDI